MLCAHIRPISFEEQSVKEHLKHVAELTKEYCSKISMDATGELIGILHDMGKGTGKYDAYIHYSAKHPEDRSLKGTIDHSTAGAKYIYDTFYSTTTDKIRKLTAQLIALAVCSHHGGLMDCLDLNGMDKFTSRMKPEKDILYDEAFNYFRAECLTEVQIRELFDKAVEEIKTVLNIMGEHDVIGRHAIGKQDYYLQFLWFVYGLLTKYLFSCLIDADRYDTYLFMENREKVQSADSSLLWKELADILEDKLKEYPQKSRIARLRADISLACKDFAENSSGIYQLAVPTGGGKTLSSLRYALNHAKAFNKDRIFYIIPFTTIIDQNAREIKDILGHEEMILEHHSNLIVEDNSSEDETGRESYRLLTERWDSPIILTTMVQFLNTLFKGGTQNVRRLHHMANSVIIFDEIQAIPIRCIHMFNTALNFLTYLCGATVILCTATQPLLESTKVPLKLRERFNIIPDVREKYKQFRRVELIPELKREGYSVPALKNFVLDRMDQMQSVLVILNTKNSAREIFKELKEANKSLSQEKRYQVFHLSTNMCPTHRLKVLQTMIIQLEHGRVVCVSTQLIEAGVNISFECVIRSLAGLDSIAQAAGRCNRHGEKERGEVYIVNVEGEDVSKLADIQKGQECTERVLRDFAEQPESFDQDLLSPQAMARYYQYYFFERRTQMNYTMGKPNRDKTLFDVLSSNKEAADAFSSRHGSPPDLILKQAFKTAGEEFQAIDENTTGILVPYEEGKDLITLINGTCALGELKHYLKKAQLYSVNLYETDRRKLEKMGALVWLKDKTILALREEFYDKEVGISFDKKIMDFCSI